jgi:dTDP-4-dehydrorhamnose 3,5-epimerase
MKFSPLKTNDNFIIEDSFIIIPRIISDERGFFFESWNQLKFDEIIGQKISFCQDNHSRSTIGVLRGMHYQLDPHSQGKLVRCTQGTIYDVAVDIRRSSKTFGKWGGVILSHENKRQLWIPKGFAHGFLTLSEASEVQYKTDGFWDKDSERSLKWNDKNLNINWPKISKFKEPTLSKKDLKAPSFFDAKSKGEIFK